LIPARVEASRTTFQTIFSVMGLSTRRWFTVPGQIRLRAHPEIVFTKHRKQLFAERNFPVDSSFTVYDPQHHSLAVYVTDP
jgi:hypothetical protein